MICNHPGAVCRCCIEMAECRYRLGDTLPSLYVWLGAYWSNIQPYISHPQYTPHTHTLLSSQQHLVPYDCLLLYVYCSLLPLLCLLLATQLLTACYLLLDTAGQTQVAMSDACQCECVNVDNLAGGVSITRRT